MEKINLVEILKDCPKGMELDCTVYDNVTLEYVCKSNSLPICVRIQNRGTIFLSKYGQFHDESYCKCIIFPKGKTTWERFQRPFKDGDIVTCVYGGSLVACIYKKRRNTTSFNHYIALYKGGLGIVVNGEICLTDNELSFASEEEKEKLFNAIKANGYRWNAETKTLEKLIEPKFKIGDRIKKKDSEEDVVLITDIVDDYYIVETQYGMEITININIQNNYELVPNKFDITTLKSFSKVLVRASNKYKWNISFFSHCNKAAFYKYSCVNDAYYSQCIPYEGNEHLLDTTDDCDEYFKTWENNHGNK